MDSERFLRQNVIISVDEQRRLKDTNVVIIGCGGLGSQLITDLVCAGIGGFVLVDPDIVSESNLNRQFIHFGNIGKKKVDSAEEWILNADPDCRVEKHACVLDADNALSLVSEGDIIADCLDNIASRRILAEACRKAGRTLVHAGVEGRYGQVMTFLPDAPIRLEDILGKEYVPDHVSFAPAVSMMGALQADELICVLLGRSDPGTLFSLDLESRTLERRSLSFR